MLFTYDKLNGLALSSVDGVTSLEHAMSRKTSSKAHSFHHVEGKAVQISFLDIFETFRTCCRMPWNHPQH